MRRVRTFAEEYTPRLKVRDGDGVRLRHDGVPLVVVERTYRLLTPLFGGGVEPRFADPVTTVRGTEVRGQLRFWWRAVRGWQAQGDLERLFTLESAIFGSAEEGGSSPVVVEVEVLEKGKEASPYRDVPGKKFPQAVREVAHPYLAFPLQRTRQDPTNYPVRQEVRFKLRLTYPETVSRGNERLDLCQELEAALWAWETFGGIGARTRRGFGALTVEGSEAPTEADIREKLGQLSRETGWPEGVPHLTPNSLVRVVNLRWEELAERYQRFRQARQKGSTGPSLWPEPEAIRYFYERRKFERGKPGESTPLPLIKFPRGQFGLPIVFQFRVGKPLPTTILAPANGDRLASPLIFRPLNTKVCVVAVLEGPRMPPEGIVLKEKKRNKKEKEDKGDEVLAPREGEDPLDVFLTEEEVDQIAQLRGHKDPIRAFVESLK